MLSTITLDGFVDFLNAYMEYEDFFSFNDLAQMCSEMNFAQFLEMFCRVACALHHKLLLGEGIQLRRAVESCRLEFSLEVLFDHLSIKLIPNDESTNLQKIRDVVRLEAADYAIFPKPRYRVKREGSLATVGQLSRRPKVAMPPALPSDAIQLLESALKFQNMAQYNMALNTLDLCKQCYQEQFPPPSDDQVDPIWTEVHLFFTLQAASVYDSAHRDTQALTKYYEAMKLARQLPVAHPGRLLVMSCIGATLFYVGELALAQQCHQLVLDARKATKNNTTNCVLVDTATAMNNVACCLSQDQSDVASKSLDNAYLLLKHARQIYVDAFGPAHPRVELISRNLDRVRACQHGVVSDVAGALARGEYAHVIPGSRFQIKAFEFASKSSKSSGKSGKSGGKKKKKGAK
ncbi:uncharacterized protein PITG_10001 [Phytophthora infestans T30-4]|uniref:Uncharacterized protein n=1 Tax=Phytophthora infestans (strain T30-4) TaxID=403677 RepID=D0NE18_PHYIT|nr:uncharacterized protein PITG_10001 [Phytophthora infestans T30-4]EEY56463.1 conserved hypothetical protein [Phytophthora infestans T30-4]|eukprot:XP_002902537.1 conserved hypothetical protein [Phytophthora infestans T30-4]